MRKGKIAVLGGGVAGLAAAYYLRKDNSEVAVFESQESPGGNCRTIKKGSFYFDTGAHRFHDKNRRVTEELLELMGPDIIKVQAPSMIFDNDRLLNFPIQISDILSKMNIVFTLFAFLSLVEARLFPREPSSFEDFAVNAYGRLMAERFLLNYSAKLWGIPCNEISQDIAGKRLKGIGLITLLKSFISKKAARKAHYEGEFLYPVGGIQKISEKLVAMIGSERILTGKKVTGLYGENGRITQVEINHRESVDVGTVVSTLPLPVLIAIMKHRVPDTVLNVSSSLRFRNIRLAAFSLARTSVNECATMYFPDQKYIFTRIYEPRNRYPGMSPDGKTMLVAEAPCSSDQSMWQCSDEEFIDTVKRQILGTGIITEGEILASYAERLNDAYPVLEKDYTDKTELVIEYLSSFQNLHLCGRNALFRYSWIHDMFNEGRVLAEMVSGR